MLEGMARCSGERSVNSIDNCGSEVVSIGANRAIGPTESFVLGAIGNPPSIA
jgi:hypothetical protein